MQPTFDIPFPQEVLTPGKHQQIDFSTLEGKIIIGLMGYAKSGKDFITKTFIEDYGYQRVAFADNIKKEMNLYLREAVFEDIQKKKREKGIVHDFKPIKLEDIDFFTEDLEMKKIIRPYIIWYGEELRNINGRFCWINRAFAEDAKGIDKIVLSDVRRLAELDIFKNSNEFKKKTAQIHSEAGVFDSNSYTTNNFGTLLFEVSQLGLTDSDALTVETIQAAHEQWLVDDIFLVDPRIPDSGPHRQKAMSAQIKRIVKKFGIEKPEKVKYTQSTIFNQSNS